MSLSCFCEDAGNLSFTYEADNDFSLLKTSKRKRCISCKVLININDDCLKFTNYRDPRDEIEDRIYGDGGIVYLADSHMCEDCGGLFFALTDLNYCIVLDGGSMKNLVNEYNRGEYV